MKTLTVRILGAVAFSAFVAASASAQTSAHPLPKFSDYPTNTTNLHKAPLALDREEREFRTRYQEIYRDRMNFAGRYTLGEVGCGMGCVFLFAIDRTTGRPSHFKVPSGEYFQDCDEKYRTRQGLWINREYIYRPNSRLFIVMGSMPGLECGVRFYVEQKGQMKLIRQINFPKRP